MFVTRRFMQIKRLVNAVNGKASRPAGVSCSLRYFASANKHSILSFDFDNLVQLQKRSSDIFRDHNYLGTWNGEKEKFDFITYGKFGDEIDKFRTVLAGLGVGKDDKISLISNNRVEWAVTYYAANGLGAQIVPLYEAQTEADWRYIIEHSDSKVLVVATVPIYDRTHKYTQEFSNLETVLCFDADAHRPYSYKYLMSKVDTAAIVSAWCPPADHLSAIVYTSGSTGSPKGVEIMHSNLVANLIGIAKTFGEDIVKDASDKVYAGVTAKVAEGTALRQWIVKKAFEIARERNALVERGLPVGTFLEWKFQKVDKIVMSKIREKILGGKLEFLSAGGGKTSLQVLQFFEDVGIPLCEGYGMTEAAPVITMSLSPGFARRRLGCVGKPIEGVSITIRDPVTQDLLPVDSEGEICVSGPVIARGYFKNPEATADTFPIGPDGVRYLRTGDLGSLDVDGFLKVSGRLKEQYKLQNGKFVSPSPIEDTLQRSPYILQAAIFGGDQEYNGALIVPDYAELSKWAEENGYEEGSIDFCTHPEVVKLITEEIVKYTSHELKHYEYVKRYTLLREPFSPENNLLTQKMSLKRHNVSKVYAETIADMFSGNIGHDVQYK